MTTFVDDLGTAFRGPQPARRVVSLVPSLTETLASVDATAVVGATQWCTHPADLAAQRIRGPKNPDIAAIVGLAPDVVVANKEENREIDVRRLRDAGMAVWVTETETVPGAVASIGRLLDGMGWSRPDWLARAEQRWGGPIPEPTRSVAIAVWRDPWMVVGHSTFTGDLVARLGWRNVFADADGRYPAVELSDLDRAGADVVLLPDEPYPFTAADGPEAFSRTPTELCDGRRLTWYGPSLVDAFGP